MKRFLIVVAVILAVAVVMGGLAVVGLRAVLSTDPVVVRFDEPGILYIDLTGLVVERAHPELLAARFEGAQNELLDIALSLDRARTDDRIAGVYLKIGPPGYGWAKAEEIRARLAAFRGSGKFVYAYSPFTDELGYFVSLEADSIYIMPDAGLGLNGFRAQVPFAREALEKLGIEAQVEAIGSYKSAGDVFRREDMSDEQREVVAGILTERYERFVEAVVASRGVDKERFVRALDQGVYLARDLEALGLVDGQVFEDDLRRRAVARALAVDAETLDREDVSDNFVNVREYARVLPDPPGQSEGTIGLVYAVGTITGGESRQDPVFGRVMGSGSIASMLREVAQDEALDGVVLRIDSPGGSALASEEIWAAVERLKERVPVIVSMGDVAASGGYYIAAGADRIVASPSTFTGSIGVVAILFNSQALYEKLGIRWETLATNPAAEFPTSTRPLTEAERATYQSLVEDAYRSFVRRVAEGREKPVPDIDAVAQGRVWTGSQAFANGLVDELGGLETAIVAAKEAAGIDPDGAVRYHIYPAKQRLVDRLRELVVLQGIGPTHSVGPVSLQPLLAPLVIRQLSKVLTGPAAALLEGPGRLLTVMPFVPQIR